MALPNRPGRISSLPTHRAKVDLIAVAIALTLAALIRFNVIHSISF